MKLQQGQALITLLFITIIGITLLATAAAITLGNVMSTSYAEQGTIAYYVAESGVEEGMLRLLRDPSYTGGTVAADGGTAVITVASGVITVTGKYSDAVRKIRVQTQNTNGLQVTSWQEIN